MIYFFILLFIPIFRILELKFEWLLNQDLFIDLYIGRKNFDNYISREFKRGGLFL